VKKDDYGFSQPFRIKKKDKTLFDLTGYTATLYIWSGATLKDSIVGTLDADPTTGKCYFTINSDTFDTAGTYSFHIKLTKTGVRISTYTYEVEVQATNPT
jgi:hypothetical protein